MMIYLQMIDTPADRSKFEQLYLEYRGPIKYCRVNRMPKTPSIRHF